MIDFDIFFAILQTSYSYKGPSLYFQSYIYKSPIIPDFGLNRIFPNIMELQSGLSWTSKVSNVVITLDTYHFCKYLKEVETQQT